MQNIGQIEGAMVKSAIARLRRHARIELLGNLDAPRLAILSFLVRASDGRYLHPRLVVRLLNDLFGIQSRGGCACAGPYAHRLLGIGNTRAIAFRDAVLGGFEAVKPGWTRLNFSYFIEPAEFEFLQGAIEFIADHGERFIDHYRCDWHSGAWQHPLDEVQPALLALATQPAPWRKAQALAPPKTLSDCLAHAHALLAALPATVSAVVPGGAPATEKLPQSLPAALVSFAYSWDAVEPAGHERLFHEHL